MVYRVSEQSIRHALDVGKSRDWLQEFFANRSKTPVPQGLTYLIDDVARRHGQLRIGMAASFVRCEDPTLLAQVVAAPEADGLALRALAPTVAVSPLRYPKSSSRCAARALPRPPKIPPEPLSTCEPAAPGCPHRNGAGHTDRRRDPIARR